MAYIRWGTRLDSGATSQSYVIGDPSSLMSFHPESKPIPYAELVELLRTRERKEVWTIIHDRLRLSDEECHVVCERLFAEKDAGEWDVVPEWGQL